MKELIISISNNRKLTCLVDVPTDNAFKHEKDELDFNVNDSNFNSKPVILIYGPGSLIIQFFSEQARKDNIFVICDDNWTSEKDKKWGPSTIKEIESTTVESEAKKINEVCVQLKRELGCSKIGLLGFSSLALMAIKIANYNKWGSKIDFVVGIGCPVYPMDKFFVNTLQTFLDRNESTGRTKQYKEDQAEFQKKFESGDLSPNSLGVAGWLSMRARFFPNFSKFGETLEKWRFGITHKIFDPTMREFFFDNVFPTINIKNVLENNVVPTLLFFGAQDGIVPPSVEILGEKWVPSTKHADKYVYHVYDDCGHYAMEEQPERFEHDLANFYQTHIAPCINSSKDEVGVSPPDAPINKRGRYIALTNGGNS